MLSLIPLRVTHSMYNRLVVVGCASAVSDNLHASNDLSNGEEANGFSSDNTSRGELLAVHVAELAQSLEGVGWSCRAGVSHGVEEVLSICLESGHVTVHPVSRVNEGVACPCFTHGGLIFCPLKISLPSSRPTLE